MAVCHEFHLPLLRMGAWSDRRIRAQIPPPSGLPGTVWEHIQARAAKVSEFIWCVNEPARGALIMVFRA